MPALCAPLPDHGNFGKSFAVLQVERSSIVAAGALVTPGTTVPTGQIWAGRPAKLLREMAEGEAAFIEQSAINYSALADIHADENAKTTEEIQVTFVIWPGPACRVSASGIQHIRRAGHERQ